MQKLLIAILSLSICLMPGVCADDYQSVPEKHGNKKHKHKKQKNQNKQNFDSATQEKIEQVRQEEQLHLSRLKQLRDSEVNNVKSGAMDDLNSLPRMRHGGRRRQPRGYGTLAGPAHGGGHHGANRYGGARHGRRNYLNQEAKANIKGDESAAIHKSDDTYQRESSKARADADERVNALIRDSKH